MGSRPTTIYGDLYEPSTIGYYWYSSICSKNDTYVLYIHSYAISTQQNSFRKIGCANSVRSLFNEFKIYIRIFDDHAECL